MNVLTNNTIITANEINIEKSPDLKFYAHHRNNSINSLALTYIIGGYTVSLVCITSKIWWLNLSGFFLLVHTLAWAGFFVHEFFHQNIFSRYNLNVAFGEIMLFITGSCYSRFRDLAPHHIAHHVHRADFSPFFPFSILDFVHSLPKPITKLIIFLESLCFPAVNFILRWMIALAPFITQNRQDERLRNASLLLLRGSLFTALAIYSPRAVIIYFLAYICFLNLIQYLEGFQHTYEAFLMHSKVPKYTLEYEEANTYSFVISRRFPWLGLVLFLNNNYHNAHHRLMSCPWYLLPKLDSELYPRNYQQYVSAFKLLGNYFRYRTHCLKYGQGNVDRTRNGLDVNEFFGATGMSFLILRKPFDWLKLTSQE